MKIIKIYKWWEFKVGKYLEEHKYHKMTSEAFKVS